jgi:ArsR family transcriptional regulator
MNAENIIKIAKALSDKNRLTIIQLISERGNMTCGEVESLLKLSQPAVSHHLKILFEAGLLDMEKEGRHVRMTLNNSVVSQFVNEIKKLI